MTSVVSGDVSWLGVAAATPASECSGFLGRGWAFLVWDSVGSRHSLVAWNEWGPWWMQGPSDWQSLDGPRGVWGRRRLPAGVQRARLWL